MFESPKSKDGTEILRLIEHQPLIEILVRTFKGKIKQRRMFFSIQRVDPLQKYVSLQQSLQSDQES